MGFNMTLLEELKTVLKKDERLVSDGELLKNKIVELALKLDEDLIKLLLGNKKIKEHFFAEVGGTLVFDKEKFMKFVDNKEFLPDSYTAFKNKIGLTADRRYIAESREVVLSWPYKDCVLEGGMKNEDEGRNEIFHNKILAPDEIDRLLEPKVFTNFKRIDSKGEHKAKEINPTDNLIISGNNLLVLHSLKKRFAGKIKLIYIDPPYNTGNDSFQYNDSFNHSTWLTFMKNRLEIARTLLSDNGSIWINIDDKEAHYLKVLCDEIFRMENFIANVIWEKSDSPRMDVTFFSTRHDHILVYAKNIGHYEMNRALDDEIPEHYNKIDEKGRRYYIKPLRVMGGHESESLFFPLTAPDGTKVLPLKKGGIKGCWRWSKKKVKEEGDRIEWVKGKRGYVPYFRIYAEGRRPTPPETIWNFEEVGSNRISKNEIKNLFGTRIFDTPKPEKLLQKIISLASNDGDLVLDFFTGSGTSGAVAHKINRKYILVEQMDYVRNVTVKRMIKVMKGEQGGISKTVGWKGGGDFVYCELKQLNDQFVRRIQRARNAKELLEIWGEMKKTSFLSYKIDPKEIDENAEDFRQLSLEDQKRFLIECLDKNDLYVNYSEIEDKQYNVGKEDIGLNKKFYEGS